MRLATQVTPATAAARIANEATNSVIGTGAAAHRTGMTIGEKKGIAPRVIARVPPGSLRIPIIITEGTTSSITTGVCACRASDSELDIDATAANIAAYRKYPRIKNRKNTPAVIHETCGMPGPAAAERPNARMISFWRSIKTALQAPQIIS